MENQTYKLIPEFSKYEINASGEVRKVDTKRVQNPKKDAPGEVQIYADDGRRRRVLFDVVAKRLFPPCVPMEKAEKLKPCKVARIKKHKGAIVVSDVNRNYKMVSRNRMNPGRILKSSQADPDELKFVSEKVKEFIACPDYTEAQKIYILINHFGLKQRLTAAVLGLNVERINGKYYRAKNNPQTIIECKKIIKDAKIQI